MEGLFAWDWKENGCRHFLEQGELTKSLETVKNMLMGLDANERESFEDFVRLAEEKLKEHIDVWIYIHIEVNTWQRYNTVS